MNNTEYGWSEKCEAKMEKYLDERRNKALQWLEQKRGKYFNKKIQNDDEYVDYQKKLGELSQVSICVKMEHRNELRKLYIRMRYGSCEHFHNELRNNTNYHSLDKKFQNVFSLAEYSRFMDRKDGCICGLGCFGTSNSGAAFPRSSWYNLSRKYHHLFMKK